MLMVIGKILPYVGFKEEGIDYEAETDPVVEFQVSRIMAYTEIVITKMKRPSGKYVIKRSPASGISMCE